MYAKAGVWSEAVSLGRVHNQIQLVSDLLKQRVRLLLTQFNEWTTTLRNHYTRLIVLRQLKTKNLEDWSGGDIDLGQSETMSEASTMSNASRLSTASTASSRKRKNVNF